MGFMFNHLLRTDDYLKIIEARFDENQLEWNIIGVRKPDSVYEIKLFEGNQADHEIVGKKWNMYMWEEKYCYSNYIYFEYHMAFIES